MRKSTKFLGALAVAGLVAAGGSAFTSTGLRNNAGPSKFIGGTVTQNVTGASLESLVYTFGDAPANEAIHSVVLGFLGDANGKTVTVAFTAGVGSAFACPGVVATQTITCTASGIDHTGATSIAITVA